jgi:hypothetical protein
LLGPVTPSLVLAQIPQVKMRLPAPDINGRGDRRDDLGCRNGHPERAEQRADYGAVTCRLRSLCKQQARLGAILSFGYRHDTPSSQPLATSVDGTAPPQRCIGHSPQGLEGYVSLLRRTDDW